MYDKLILKQNTDELYKGGKKMTKLKSFTIFCISLMIMLNVYSQRSLAQGDIPNDFGAKGALNDSSITLEEALTYAIQDEYLAQARYENIINKFGSIQPFIQIKTAEERHITALQRLFQKYNIKLPENNAKQYAQTPSTIKEALQSGVEGEIANIKMYEKLTSLPSLPSDIKRVMGNLRNASTRHLAAFKAGLQQ